MRSHKKIISFFTLTFLIGSINGQVKTYESKSTYIEFPYFDFVELSCPCTTPNMAKVGLNSHQLLKYKSAQGTADSLTRLYSPCYEFRARFICGIYYSHFNSSILSSINQLNFNPQVYKRQVIFTTHLPPDSTICPAWQITIVKIRSVPLLKQQHSGTTICDYDLRQRP